MGSGKQSKAGQAARRQQIIDYIRENGPVKGSDLCRDLKMSRSSLSDDLRAINTAGEIICSPKKGTYVINMSRRTDEAPYSKIDLKAVRRWLILFALREHDLDFEEICSFLSDSGIDSTEGTLYKDLGDLQEEGLIHRLSDGKRRYYRSGCLYEVDQREIRQYRKKQAGRNARIDIATFQGIDLKIKHCVPGPEGEDNSAGSSGSVSGPADPAAYTRSAGKKNLLTSSQLKMLQNFEKYPFADKELKVVFRTAAGHELTRDLQVGLIIYSVETSRIYLLGKNLYKQYLTIPLDRLLSVEEGERPNICYNTPEFHRIFQEMFQISTEEPLRVRVRFQNLPFIREKIERLCKVRSKGRIEYRDDELIYTDTIRGEGDFARYLRRFGKSAIVEAPESLRDKMIQSSRLILDLYGVEPAADAADYAEDKHKQ